MNESDEEIPRSGDPNLLDEHSIEASPILGRKISAGKGFSLTPQAGPSKPPTAECEYIADMPTSLLKTPYISAGMPTIPERPSKSLPLGQKTCKSSKRCLELFQLDYPRKRSYLSDSSDGASWSRISGVETMSLSSSGAASSSSNHGREVSDGGEVSSGIKSSSQSRHRMLKDSLREGEACLVKEDCTLEGREYVVEVEKMKIESEVEASYLGDDEYRRKGKRPSDRVATLEVGINSSVNTVKNLSSDGLVEDVLLTSTPIDVSGELFYDCKNLSPIAPETLLDSQGDPLLKPADESRFVNTSEITVADDSPYEKCERNVELTKAIKETSEDDLSKSLNEAIPPCDLEVLGGKQDKVNIEMLEYKSEPFQKDAFIDCDFYAEAKKELGVRDKKSVSPNSSDSDKENVVPNRLVPEVSDVGDTLCNKYDNVYKGIARAVNRKFGDELTIPQRVGQSPSKGTSDEDSSDTSCSSISSTDNVSMPVDVLHSWEKVEDVKGRLEVSPTNNKKVMLSAGLDVEESVHLSLIPEITVEECYDSKRKGFSAKDVDECSKSDSSPSIASSDSNVIRRASTVDESLFRVLSQGKLSHLDNSV